MNIDSYPILNIIPEPKRMARNRCRFGIPRSCKTFKGDGSDYANAFILLTKGLQQNGLRVSSLSTIDICEAADRRFFLICEKEITPGLRKSLDNLLQRDTPKPEGYLLDVSADGVAVVAADPHGLFYAVQTLLQLVQSDGDGLYLPGVTIEDSPDLALRGTNLPARRIFRDECTSEYIRALARYKINTILLEYDDSMAFDKHPDIAGDGAWTKQQIEDFIRLAEENCITVIPLLQSLGHVESILKHEAYSHLREREDILTQYCPSNPKTFEFYIELCEEVLALHPGSGYFHIGGDETYHLGKCPACAAEASRVGKSGLYIDYINKIGDYLRSKGKTPMIWDDMLTEYPEEIDRLPKDTAIVYWDYTPADPESPCLLFRNKGYYCDKPYWGGRKWKGADIPSARIKDVSSMPEELAATYRRYLNTDSYPRYLKHYPFQQFYKDKGFNVIGAPAAVGGEYNYCAVDLNRRLDNILGMIGTVHKTRSEGAIVTSWLDGGMSKQVAWYPMLAGAEHMWFYRGVSGKDFDRKFTERLFGINATDIVWAMHQIGESIPLCYNIEDNDIDDLESYGVFAESYSLKEMLDRRIEKMESNPDLYDILAKSRETLANARQALSVLEKHKDEVQRNRAEYDRLLLAARLTEHKAEQVLLFHAAEESLSENAELLPLMQSFKNEMVALRKELNRAYADLLKPFALERHISLIFDGEEEKVAEYIHRLKCKSDGENL